MQTTSSVLYLRVFWVSGFFAWFLDLTRSFFFRNSYFQPVLGCEARPGVPRLVGPIRTVSNLEDFPAALGELFNGSQAKNEVSMFFKSEIKHTGADHIPWSCSFPEFPHCMRMFCHDLNIGPAPIQSKQFLFCVTLPLCRQREGCIERNC